MKRMLACLLLATAAPAVAGVFAIETNGQQVGFRGNANRDLVSVLPGPRKLWDAGGTASAPPPVTITLQAASPQPITVIAYNQQLDEVGRGQSASGQITLTASFGNQYGYLRIVPTGSTYDTPVGTKFKRSLPSNSADTALLPAYRLSVGFAVGSPRSTAMTAALAAAAEQDGAGAASAVTYLDYLAGKTFQSPTGSAKVTINEKGEWRLQAPGGAVQYIARDAGGGYQYWITSPAGLRQAATGSVGARGTSVCWKSMCHYWVAAADGSDAYLQVSVRNDGARNVWGYVPMIADDGSMDKPTLTVWLRRAADDGGQVAQRKASPDRYLGFDVAGLDKWIAGPQTTSSRMASVAADPPQPATIMRHRGGQVAKFASFSPRTATEQATNDPATTSAPPTGPQTVRDLLRIRIGPLADLIGVSMMRAKKFGPTSAIFSLTPKGSSSRLVMTEIHSTGEAREEFAVNLDQNFIPGDFRFQIRPVDNVAMQVVSVTATTILIADRSQNPGAAVYAALSADGEFSFERGRLVGGRFRAFGGEWSGRFTYRPTSADVVSAELARYQRKNSSDGNDFLGRALAGAMVGGWTSGGSIAGMASGAAAAIRGPEAFQDEIRSRALTAQQQADILSAAAATVRAREAGGSAGSGSSQPYAGAYDQLARDRAANDTRRAATNAQIDASRKQEAAAFGASLAPVGGGATAGASGNGITRTAGGSSAGAQPSRASPNGSSSGGIIVRADDPAERQRIAAQEAERQRYLAGAADRLAKSRAEYAKAQADYAQAEAERARQDAELKRMAPCVLPKERRPSYCPAPNDKPGRAVAR